MCDTCNEQKKKPDIFDPLADLGAVISVKKPYYAYRVLKDDWLNKVFYTYQYIQVLQPNKIRIHIIYWLYEKKKELQRTYQGREYYDEILDAEKVDILLNQMSNDDFSNAIPSVTRFLNKNIAKILSIVQKKQPNLNNLSKQTIGIFQQSDYPQLKGCGSGCTRDSECGGGCGACYFFACGL